MKMCVFVSPEVVLANLLVERNQKPLGKNDSRFEPSRGVGGNDINVFCSNFRRILSKETEAREADGFVYFDLNREAFDSTLADYQNDFVEFQGRIFQRHDLAITLYNDGFSKEVQNALTSAAKAATVR